ncbi:uncharacterized protein [Fopius arisanus]|uniref:CIDE-N domain-containing protein n=1 Tax=Fopius arisanus TaxID=64838 RepID=A0A9R1SXK9_9HYME|nr:PREDICTED: uncharacterized protein LOC105264059 [Fopius arisanus]
MAIFKVTRHDKPSLKKLVKAETVTELIDAAKTKLSLTDTTYKIFMEDLTEIDDDEILQELASTSKEQLMLILVPDGIDWDGSIMTKNKPDVSDGKNYRKSREDSSARSIIITSIFRFRQYLL